MADRKQRRPVVGSRNPTARPRKVAGGTPPASASPAPSPVEPVRPLELVETPEPPEILEPVEAAERGGLLTGRRTTVGLVVVSVVLAVALAVEAIYLLGRDEPVVSAERPVVTGEIAHRAAVEAASQSTTEILSYGYQDFDDQVDEATSKMTDAFAAKFRETAEGIEEEFVAQRTEQEVKVVAASVVQASSAQVQALLFLDQYVQKQGKGTAVTPYRALVTVVHTESGWLVSDIQTR